MTFAQFLNTTFLFLILGDPPVPKFWTVIVSSINMYALHYSHKLYFKNVVLMMVNDKLFLWYG